MRTPSGREAEHRRSLDDPGCYWGEAAAAIEWSVEPGRVLDRGADGSARWFEDGSLNVAANALDRHVRLGAGERTALAYESPVTGRRESFAYSELTARVSRVAGALRRLGVGSGDRVLIYMPMVPEAVLAMLACARIGAIHSVVFGGFAPPEVAARIDDARPKVVLSASCGIEPSRIVEYAPLLDEAVRRCAHRPDRRVVLQRPECPAALAGDSVSWDEFLEGAPAADPVPVPSRHPLYILYTSGTTGRPKGVVRESGPHAVALRWSMDAVYRSGAGDVFWAASDIGWVVGHSYIVYAPLLAGCTTVLFEGKPVGTPDAAEFWRVVERRRVKTLFTAPTAIRAIRRVDPDGELVRDHDLSSLEALFLAGERTDPDTFRWARAALGVPVVDHWWQTETGSPITSTCLGLGDVEQPAGSAGGPVPGYDVRVLDAEGAELPPGGEGSMALKLPLPPGAAQTLWGDEAGYREAYLSAHPGYYVSGDGGSIDDRGFVHVMGRVDDVINVAGHRLSTGALEGAISEHPAVAECAVIGVGDELKGQVPAAFVVVKAGFEAEPDRLAEELALRVRDEVGAIATPARVEVVEMLPKTRSGKVLRRTMRAIAEGHDYSVPPTIEDARALEAVAAAAGRAAAPATSSPGGSG